MRPLRWYETALIVAGICTVSVALCFPAFGKVSVATFLLTLFVLAILGLRGTLTGIAPLSDEEFVALNYAEELGLSKEDLISERRKIATAMSLPHKYLGRDTTIRQTVERFRWFGLETMSLDGLWDYCSECGLHLSPEALETMSPGAITVALCKAKKTLEATAI